MGGLLGGILGTVVSGLIGNLFHHHHEESPPQQLPWVSHAQDVSQEWGRVTRDARQAIDEYVKPQVEAFRKQVMKEIQQLVRVLREEHQRVKSELASKGMLNTAWGQNIYDKMTQNLEQNINKLITQIHAMNLDALRQTYLGVLNARANLALGLYRQALESATLQAQNEQQYGQALAQAMSGLFHPHHESNSISIGTPVILDTSSGSTEATGSFDFGIA